MAMRAVAEMVLPKGHAFLSVAEFLGDPVMATLIAVLIAMFTFGGNQRRNDTARGDCRNGCRTQRDTQNCGDRPGHQKRRHVGFMHHGRDVFIRINTSRP